MLQPARLAAGGVEFLPVTPTPRLAMGPRDPQPTVPDRKPFSVGILVSATGALEVRPILRVSGHIGRPCVGRQGCRHSCTESQPTFREIVATAFRVEQLPDLCLDLTAGGNLPHSTPPPLTEHSPQP
jgi:hypothetical protein